MNILPINISGKSYSFKGDHPQTARRIPWMEPSAVTADEYIPPYAIIGKGENGYITQADLEAIRLDQLRQQAAEKLENARFPLPVAFNPKKDPEPVPYMDPIDRGGLNT